MVDVLTHPLGMLGSDSLFSARPHPRTYGTYARWFSKYVRDEGVMTLEEAAYKCSGYPCEKLRITDRGKLEVGYHADLVIMDFHRLTDNSTFESPVAYPSGIEHVFVNGTPVKLNGRLTGSSPGVPVLRC